MVQKTRNVDTDAHVIDVPVRLTVQAPADAATAVENTMDWDFQGSGSRIFFKTFKGGVSFSDVKQLTLASERARKVDGNCIMQYG
jgi:hypothetical protein